MSVFEVSLVLLVALMVQVFVAAFRWSGKLVGQEEPGAIPSARVVARAPGCRRQQIAAQRLEPVQMLQAGILAIGITGIFLSGLAALGLAGYYLLA